MGAGVFLGLPARALNINVTYDASVSSQAFFTNVQTAIGSVTQAFHVLFTNSSSVNVTCYWGAVGPFSGGIGLGASITRSVGLYSYAQLTNAMRNARTSSYDSNAVASLPASDPVATNRWWLPPGGSEGFGHEYYFQRCVGIYQCQRSVK